MMLILDHHPRMTSQVHYTCLITCSFAFFSAVHVAAINTYKMDFLCNREISLDVENVYTGIIRFKFSTYLESNKNCSIILSTISADHISFYFTNLNIGPSCRDGYLVALDGRFLASAKIRDFPERLCGDDVSRVAANRYFSWGTNVLFQFVGTEQTKLNAGFDIVFTSFDDGPCIDDNYRCDNGHCIMSDLRCSGMDPCGDSSDCKPEGFSGGQIAGIAIGCFTGFLMMIFAVILIFCCRRNSRCRQRTTCNDLSYPARVAFRNQSRNLGSNSGNGNQTATPDPVMLMRNQGICDLPPPYEQVIREGGFAFPSDSDFVFKDLPTYAEATGGEIGISLNK